MEVQTWDSVFIRATRRQLHPVFADLPAFQGWWPGLTVRGDGPTVVLRLRAPGLLRRPRRFTARLVKDRPDLGVTLHYDGDVTGEAEFYYLDEPAGTVVHYVLRGAVPDRGWRAAVRDHRAGVRAGLDVLKDRFERGRTPGDEPGTRLLADQRQAMTAFAERVAASKRRQAQAPAEAQTPAEAQP